MKLKIKYSYLLAGMFVAVGLASCVKDRNSQATDFSNLQPMVEIRDPVVNDAGLTNFSAASLSFTADPDTISFYVNLASVNALGKDLTVSVDIDNTALSNYNGLGGIQYKVFPDSNFKFVSKTAVIKAGQHVSLVKVVFYPSKIDPSVNYMLPVSIKDAQGVGISGNFGTIYYHLIGNPLAGKYSQDFYRWNTTGVAADTTTPPNSTTFTGTIVTVSPLSPTDLLLPESYIQTFVGTSAGIDLSFTNSAGVLSNFGAGFDPGTLSGLASGSFTISTSPKLVSYTLAGNAANHYAGTKFRTFVVLINSSGGTRTCIDNFTKQ